MAKNEGPKAVSSFDKLNPDKILGGRTIPPPKKKTTQSAEFKTIPKLKDTKKAPETVAGSTSVDQLFKKINVGDRIEVTEDKDAVTYTILENGEVSFVVNGIQETMPLERMQKYLNLSGISFKKLEPEKKTAGSSKGPSKAKEKLTPEQKREKTVEQIIQLFNKGIYRVVVHGERTIEGENGESYVKTTRDFDTIAAMELLNSSTVTYNNGTPGEVDGAQTEFVPKGNITKGENIKKGQVIVHIDTGGKGLSVEKGADGSINVFIDHHQQEYEKTPTSATALMYEILRRGKFIGSEAWMGNLQAIATNFDNLTYVRSEKHTEAFLRETWPKSIMAVVEDVPFAQVKKWAAENRNILAPNFSQEELNGISFERERATKGKGGKKMRIKEIITLGQLVEERRQEINADLDYNIPKAQERMHREGIKDETPEVGKFVYNTKEPELLPNGKNRYIKFNHGFIAARAKGLDTLIAYNEQDKGLFINSSRDLNPIYKKLKKVFPGLVLVRGVMILQSKKKEERDMMTREKLFEVLGLKLEDKEYLEQLKIQIDAGIEEAQRIRKQIEELKASLDDDAEVVEAEEIGDEDTATKPEAKDIKTPSMLKAAIEKRGLEIIAEIDEIKRKLDRLGGLVADAPGESGAELIAKKRALETEGRENLKRWQEEEKKELEADEKDKPLLYFGARKIRDSGMRELFTTNTTGQPQIDLRFMSDKNNIYYRDDFKSSGYGGYFEFNVLGFKKVIDHYYTTSDGAIEETGSTRYRIVGPFGMTVAEVTGIGAAEEAYRNATEEYRKQLEKEFNNQHK